MTHSCDSLIMLATLKCCSKIVFFPEKEFLDINLTKDSSLLRHSIHSPFYSGGF